MLIFHNNNNTQWRIQDLTLRESCVCRPHPPGAASYTCITALSAGLPWTRLPHVTPAQIQAARKIRKFLTGDLEAQVSTSVCW